MASTALATAYPRTRGTVVIACFLGFGPMVAIAAGGTMPSEGGFGPGPVETNSVTCVLDGSWVSAGGSELDTTPLGKSLGCRTAFAGPRSARLKLPSTISRVHPLTWGM